MSRTLTAGLATHLAGRAHTRCSMALLTLSDGTAIGITDHDRDLVFDLGDGAVTYLAETGIKVSDISLSVGLEPDNCEIEGPIGDVVTRAAVSGGRFDRASVKLFQVNHRKLSDGPIRILAGNIAQARVEGGRFIFEVRSEADKFNQPVGRVLSPMCDADYGDARCGATPETVVGTVASVTDEFAFEVTFSGTYADGFFDFGTVEALTGALAGTRPVEIITWTAAGAITLFAPLVESPAVGDTFTIKRGCPKSRSACVERNNAARFRGFPEIPGSDQILRAAIPGQGNDE